MDFVEYGNPEGRIVVYLHGVPGSIEECSVFDSHAKNYNLRILIEKPITKRWPIRLNRLPALSR